MKLLPPLLRSAFVLSLAAVALAARSDTLSFPGITLGTSGGSNTTSVVSNLGPLAQGATLNFSFTSLGSTAQSDLQVTLTDPTGQRVYLPLPGATPTMSYGGPVPYTGTVQFGSLVPSSGTYSIGFHNTYISSYTVTLSDISLVVTPVPEPASLAVVGLGSLAVLRRRKRA